MNGRVLVGCALAAAVAVAVVASPASGKGRVVARVLTPIPRDTLPGTRLRVVWTLSLVNAGPRQPVNAEGVFIRLVGRDGALSPRVYAFQPTLGRYRATVTVPRGGVRRVVIGLMGTACDPAGCRPSPALFPIAGDPFR